jgi:hypothetical protein
MSRFEGMTTNERLFEAGLLDLWDAALARRDRNKMIVLLGRVDLAEQAGWITEQTLRNEAD